MATDEKESPEHRSPLAGPAVVSIDTASPRGPFARKGANLRITPARLCVVNTGNTPVEVAHLTLDQLQQAKTGTAVEASVNVQAAPRQLAPGESAEVKISGFIPAAPGVYTSTLRVTPTQGAPLAIRVELRVAAHALWGLACMILGLSLVALINMLDSESGIKGNLRDAFLAREFVRELRQQTPPPRSLAAQVDSIDREFDAAIDVLQRPREISFNDHRSADAREHMKTAAELTADLRKALSQKPRGAIEVAEIAQEWSELTNQFSRLSGQFVVAAPQGALLARRLDAFDALAAQRLLQPDIAFFTGELSKDTAHVQLLYAAGRDRDAAEVAIAVRRRMQRAADAVNTQAQLLRRFNQQSANDIATDLTIRKRIDSGGFGNGASEAIVKPLDEAAAMLAGPFSWTTRRDVAMRVQQARSALLAAVSAATTQKAQLAAAQAEQEYSMAAVQAVVDEGAKLRRGADGKISDANEKMAWIRRVLAAWRARLATLPDPKPPAISPELDAVEVAIGSGDLDAVSAHMSAAFRKMAGYSAARATSEVLKTTAPACLQIREDILIDLEAVRQTMSRLDSDPALVKWEAGLDSLRRKTHATPDVADRMPADCLGAMIGLSGNLAQLRNEIDSATWSASVLPDATKQELASDFAKSLTPQALATFLSDVRPLRVEVATAPDERYVGRRIEFKVANLGPDWGLDVNVAIDFGDGQSAFMTAEELHRNKSVRHAFFEARRFTIVARAMEMSAVGATPAAQRTIGMSQNESVSIVRSPISAARELSETFFNARFGLALLVAGLLYFWRFHAKKIVFGANGFDYAEAFALGFAVSLAINNLPEKLAKFYGFAG